MSKSQIHLRIDEETRRQLAIAAACSGKSKNEIILEALKKDLTEREKLGARIAVMVSGNTVENTVDE